MRSCLDYWQISRYPLPCSLCEKKQLEDATNLPRNSSQHQICILWCGTPCCFS
jgi:hypothetical protein